MNNFQELLLQYYNINNDEFSVMTRNIDQIKLPIASNIQSMDIIIKRVQKAIDNKEKIIIYGDYDCDGVCSTTIMLKTFKLLNYPVSYYIPSRYIDGYGLNVENVEKIIKNDYKLIITVDNGICAHEAIDYAKENGIDTIVIDHHQATDIKNLNCLAYIHPTLSNIMEINGSGGLMSLLVSSALLGYYHDYLITLAGLSTISDMMDLKDLNRDIVRLSINNLKNNKYNQLIKLCNNIDIINEKTFSLQIAPKINAIGRMIEDRSVLKIVNYLIEENEQKQDLYIEWINGLNNQRKELTKNISESLNNIDESKSCIIVKSDIKEGIIGLVCNTFLNKYNKPTIVFTKDSNNPNHLVGSFRSKEGFDISHCLKELQHLLIRGGGHKNAGGVTIEASIFDTFCIELEKYSNRHPFVEIKQEYIDISIKDITMSNYAILEVFSPFGHGFEEPLFKLSDISTKNISFISSGKHLSNEISCNAKLFGFNIDEHAFKSIKFVNLFGNFNLNSYKNYTTLNFQIIKYEQSIK